MRRSRSPSRTELVAVAVAAGALTALAGCSSDDDSCGPGDAPANGLTLTVGAETVTYGGFTSSENNDCRLATAPAGVISVTIEGAQTGGTFAFSLCLPRPDLIGAEAVPLVPSRPSPMEDDRVMVVDTSAMLMGGCTVAKDIASPPSGTARFLGYCDGGANSAGYALEIAGTVPLVRTCGGTMENVTGTLSGTVAVAAQ